MYCKQSEEDATGHTTIEQISKAEHSMVPMFFGWLFGVVCCTGMKYLLVA
jgi:hypothetical protein